MSLPTRSPTTATSATRTSTMSEEDAIPAEDTSEVTKLFAERLSAWKHACGYLEDYVKATEKLHHSHGKEYEKLLKTVSSPLKEGQHFDRQLGGVAGMFESIRSNTTGISNSNYETAKVLKGTVLPVFERLHSEIKSKTKELTKGAGKGSKAVDKARNATQTHIEKLGQRTAAWESSGGKISAADDPYLLQRGTRHRLNKQIIEENNNRQDLIQVQNSFADFEAHILTTLQNGLGQLNTVVGKQMDQTKIMYGDMTSTAQRVPVDFEWTGFVKRNSNILIDPASAPRSMDSISFPNMNHPSTQPLVAGSLERKGKVMRKYNSAFYVVTPSKFLHEFETDDDLAKDPTPENSLYLPDCVVGALDGAKFNVKGKDANKKLGVNMSTTHEYQFKAHTPQDAATWYQIIKSAAGQVTADLPETSAPASPVAATLPAEQPISAAAADPEKHQTTGVTGQTTGTLGASPEHTHTSAAEPALAAPAAEHAVAEHPAPAPGTAVTTGPPYPVEKV